MKNRFYILLAALLLASMPVFAGGNSAKDLAKQTQNLAKKAAELVEKVAEIEEKASNLSDKDRRTYQEELARLGFEAAAGLFNDAQALSSGAPEAAPDVGGFLGLIGGLLGGGGSSSSSVRSSGPPTPLPFNATHKQAMAKLNEIDAYYKATQGKDNTTAALKVQVFFAGFAWKQAGVPMILAINSIFIGDTGSSGSSSGGGTTQAQRDADPVAAARSLRTSGDTHREAGRYDAAIADYTEAIRLQPENAVYYNQRGLAYRQKTEYDRAIADYTVAIRLDSDNSNKAIYYSNRAYTYNQKSDYDRAITDATEAIRLNPNYSSAHRNRAVAYMKKGNYAQARADVDRALQISPNYESAKEVDAELRQLGY